MLLIIFLCLFAQCHSASTISESPGAILFDISTAYFAAHPDRLKRVNGGELLHKACRFGKLNFIKLLREHQDVVEIPIKVYGEGLLIAIEESQPHVARYLIDDCQLLNLMPTNWSILHIANPFHVTLLTSALYRDNVEVATLLLDRVTNKYELDNAFWTGKLNFVCQLGYTEIVKLILPHKKFDKVEEYIGALIEACKHGHFEIVKLLLVRNILLQVDGTPGPVSIPASIACANKHFDVFKLFLCSPLWVGKCLYWPEEYKRNDLFIIQVKGNEPSPIIENFKVVEKGDMEVLDWALLCACVRSNLAVLSLLLPLLQRYASFSDGLELSESILKALLWSSIQWRDRLVPIEIAQYMNWLMVTPLIERYRLPV